MILRDFATLKQETGKENRFLTGSLIFDQISYSVSIGLNSVSEILEIDFANLDYLFD
jgi:hypothetical protein